MGTICCLPVDSVTSDINHKLNAAHRKDFSSIKLLFLGAGSAGKSTIFKQLKLIHNQSMAESERTEHIETIRTDLITNIKKLIRKSESLYRKDHHFFRDCKLPKNDAGVMSSIESIYRSPDHAYVEPGSAIVVDIQRIWRLSAIQATWEQRQYFAIPDSAHYFFENIERVCEDEYRPTVEDLLLARVRTTGIVEATFDYDGKEFQVVDVGGQRNERKKWSHCFDGVTAVIYVASLSSYCEVLFEDERKNGMEESLSIFEDVANSDTFKNKDIILFLNKYDLFEERIRRGIPLSVCFGDEYRGTNFDPNGGTEDEYEDALKENLVFIQGRYSNLKDHPDFAVYIHITQATDRDNVQKVFWDVQNIVLRNALKSGHLL